MEVKELQQKSSDKLREQLASLRAELQKLRFENASGRLKRVREIRRVRQAIAQVITIMRGRNKQS